MKKLLFLLALITGSIFSLSLSSSVLLAQPQSVCEGANLAGTEVDCADGRLEPSDSQFGNLVRTIINIMSIVVGAVSVIMIIVGGFRYVVSGGDSNGVSGAKNTIMYAIIGLVIVIFAQVIVQFVFDNASTPAQSEQQEG